MPTRLMPTIRTSLKLMREKIIGAHKKIGGLICQIIPLPLAKA